MDIEELLPGVMKPARYIGGEYNSVVKEEARVRIGLVYPDLYEIGMSYIGLSILYFLINSFKEVAAERIFMPDKDMVERLREKGRPLFSLETRRPIKDFDLIAFSLLYELNYTNLLWILHLGNIPLLSKDRGEEDPLVAAGGPCAANPEPLADFVDFFYVGDGEPVFQEIAEILQSEQRRDRRLELISQLEGVYVPAYHIHERRRHSRGYWYYEGVEVKKRIIADLSLYPFPEKRIVPHTEAVFDRVSWEIARGCAQRCRFCQATFYYAPYRIRPVPEILDGVKRSLVESGFEAFSLSSLNTADFPKISSIMADLAEQTSSWRISMSVSSLRPHIMKDERFSRALSLVRKAGFTIVPEAGTERLRKVINKDVSNKEIKEACLNAFSMGWTSFKLYFMIGLPTEQEEDLKGIYEIVKKVSDLGKEVLGRKPQIHVSISNFIPKPHTPFQWLGFETPSELNRKQLYLFSLLKRMRNVKISMHRVEQSFVEAYLSRSDFTAGKVLLSVWRKGGILEAWRDHFNFELWKNSWKEEGVDPLLYTGEFSPHDPLPWEHIYLGTHRDYLLAELEKALKGEPTPSCTANLCGRCKGCDYWNVFRRKQKVELKSSFRFPVKRSAPARRYWVYYKKRGTARFLSQTDLIRTVERVFRRALIPLSFTQGFHPRPRMSFPPALPVGVEGEEELFEVFVEGELGEKELERMNQVSIDGLVFIRAEPREEKLSAWLKYAVYSAPAELEEVIKELGFDYRAEGDRVYFLHPLSTPSPAKRLREADKGGLIYRLKRVKLIPAPEFP